MLSASVQTSSLTCALPSGTTMKTSLPIRFPGLTLMHKYPPQPTGLHFSFSMTAMRFIIRLRLRALYLNSRLLRFRKTFITITDNCKEYETGLNRRCWNTAFEARVYCKEPDQRLL